MDYNLKSKNRSLFIKNYRYKINLTHTVKSFKFE